MDEIDKFRRELEIRNFSKKTVKSYVYLIERFLEYAQGMELDENTVKDYVQNLIKRQNLLGHSDIKTTQIYIQISNQMIKNIKSPLDNLE